jgi:hypothetical protein
MQQRQPRLGDILDDYCPRERRLTNHAVVAMIGDDIRLTRCTTCDTEHDYKHARVPRVRKKNELPIAPALAAPAPRRIVAEPPPVSSPVIAADAAGAVALKESAAALTPPIDDEVARVRALLGMHRPGGGGDGAPRIDDEDALLADAAPPRREEGPVHRQLIRAQLTRPDGQPPAQQRQAPDFTIRQPGGRPNRFRGQQRGGGFGGGFYGGPSSHGNGQGHGARQGHGAARGNGPRAGGPGQRQHNSRKRSK